MNATKEDRGLFPLDGNRGYNDTSYHQDQFPLMAANSNNATSMMPNMNTNAPNANASSNANASNANAPILTGPMPSDTTTTSTQPSPQPVPDPTPTPTPSPPVVHSTSKMSDWNYVFFFGGLMLMIISAILFFAVYNKPIDAMVPK